MISLVTATIGRTTEVQLLLESLRKQTFKDFELIIVDQNPHNIIADIVELYKDTMSIKYIKSCEKGLSRNRNIGLKNCNGSIIGFPDDDCTYSDNVLQEVHDILITGKYRFCVVEAMDPTTGQIFIPKETCTLKRKDTFKKCISFNFFVINPRDVYFDENLGVGAKFGSGEETDYLWQILNNNDIGRFLPSARVYHLAGAASCNYDRAFKYGLGFGAIFKKEIIHRRNILSIWSYMWYIIRTIGGCIIGPNRLFYIYTLKGRIVGFLKY